MTLEAEQAHSPLGPSAAERWLNCPGSVNATRGIPDTSSEFAAEGTFAHMIAEMARDQDRPAKDFIGHQAEIEGFDFTCDKLMAQHVQYFIDYVNQWEGDETLNESKLAYDSWVDGGFGTVDAAILNDGACLVIDLKYGKGIQVFATDNAQLKLYALALFQEYGDLYQMDKFKLCIVQPRLDHIDEWEISIEELLVWADETVEPKAEEAMHDTASFKAGDWCRWCKIRDTCKTRYNYVKDQLLDEIGEIRDPNEMETDELGEAMDLVPLIKKWADDIQSRVEKLVLAGEKIIGADGLPYKMVAGRGSRSWDDEEAVVQTMRNYKLRMGDVFEKKLISPAKAEKLSKIGKGHPLLKKHVVTKQGKPALVPGSDPREAYKTDTDEMDDLDDDDLGLD